MMKDRVAPFGEGGLAGNGAATATPPEIARGKDQTNGTKEESKPAIFQDAAESIHRHPGFGRNHGGRAATRPSHSCQWRRWFRKDTVRTGVPGSGRYTIR